MTLRSQSDAEVPVAKQARTTRKKRKTKPASTRAKATAAAKPKAKRAPKSRTTGKAGARPRAKAAEHTATASKTAKGAKAKVARSKNANRKDERTEARPRPTRFRSGLPAAPAAAVTKRRAAPARAKLTPEDIAEFRTLLLEKRAQLVGDVQQLQDEALKKSRQDAAGDLSRMPIHMADIGSDNWDQEFNLILLQNEQNLLKEIDEALARIEEGTYGLCSATGKPISKTRLRAKPWAKYCIEYARLKEIGHG